MEGVRRNQTTLRFFRALCLQGGRPHQDLPPPPTQMLALEELLTIRGFSGIFRPTHPGETVLGGLAWGGGSVIRGEWMEGGPMGGAVAQSGE